MNLKTKIFLAGILTFITSNAMADFDGKFWISNTGIGDYLSIGNTAVYSNTKTVSSSRSGDAVKWEFIQNGSYYHIRNVATGHYIRPRNADDFSEIYTVPNTWTGDWTQWTIEDHGSEGYRFINRST